MLPADFYKQNLSELQETLQNQLKKRSLFGWSRFGLVALLIFIAYLVWPLGWLYITASIILILIVFTRLIFADLRNKTNIEKTRNLISINEDEIKILNHDYHHFPDGMEHTPNEHFYANDLDIFGKASLFQFINRTNSEMGSTLLGHWLLYPATSEVIVQRQLAVKDLSTQTQWRQELQSFGRQKKIQLSTQQRLQNWLLEPGTFLNSTYWHWLRFVVPALIIGLVLLNIAGIIPYQIRNMGLLASAIFAYFIAKKTAPVYIHLSKIVSELQVLATSMAHIETLNCTSELLVKMKAGFVEKNHKASDALKEIKSILSRLDLRINPVVYIPLSILFQWDLQQVFALEQWKKRNHENALQWFDMLAQFETISSLATLSFNHPEWCFPLLKKDHFYIEGNNIGHPLINAAKRVNNNIFIEKKGEIMLITGSNMAGKSTYLRSIGINVVLAMAGSPVCATTFILSPVQILSSMRIADNLAESTSTFYAELKKLKTVIDCVNEKAHVFILLDEILRGTNSLDRHTGSVALLKQLIKKEAAGIIATHDVELAELKTVYPENILNYHFDAQINKEELYFDYKIKTGVCENLNASILMKKIGIEL